VARLCDAVADLFAAQPPNVAAPAWMDRSVDYMTTKRGMANALRVVIGIDVFVPDTAEQRYIHKSNCRITSFVSPSLTRSRRR
jgi:hypothetical protein